MGETPLGLSRAADSDLDVITGLIDEAADWLRTKNTDQWAQPWPSVEDRSDRILTDLLAGRTWIAWDGDTPAATITASSEDNPIWPAETRRERAVYVCRLVVRRGYSGRELGAMLLDLAGISAQQAVGARWIRVDVWTTNRALHAYYMQRGFEFCGFCENADHYPAAALFQKSTDGIDPECQLRFGVARPPDAVRRWR
jgi:GNAT superfamily N-acetyltransferase